MSNVRRAPLFLRPSVVRGLIEASNLIRNGVVQVPFETFKLVDRPRPSEDARLAKANDDLPANMPAQRRTKQSGRVAPPVASEPVPAVPAAVQDEPEDWPDAPLPDHADPDLDRPEPGMPEEFANCSRPPVKQPGLDGMAARESVSQTQLAKPAAAIEAVCEKRSPTEQALDRNAMIREAAEALRNTLAHKPRRRDGLYRQARQADARNFEQPVDVKVDRLAAIRLAARRLEERKAADVPARPSLGLRQGSKPMALPALPFEARRKQLDAAIAYLKRCGILITVADRDAPIRKYRVSGKLEARFAEEVIELAISRGLVMGRAEGHDA